MPFTAQINLELCNYFKIETLTESFALFNVLTFPSPKKYYLNPSSVYTNILILFGLLWWKLKLWRRASSPGEKTSRPRVPPKGPHHSAGCPQALGGATEADGTYLNSSTPTLAHGVGHGSPGRINHGDETNKAEIFNREIHFVCVKLEAFGELLVRQQEVAETCKEARQPVRTQ